MSQQQLRMPMVSAGILGISSDEMLAGIQMDPKIVILATLIFVGFVKLAGLLVK